MQQGGLKQPGLKAARLEDCVFKDADEETLPLPATGGTIAGITRSENVDTKRARTEDPYGLGAKTEVKGEPSKPVKAKRELKMDQEEMDVSILREQRVDDLDTISETNLSDEQVIDEYPEVELEKTEKILEDMGTKPSPGMSELCDDIVMLLQPTTSTPKAKPDGSSSSSVSTHPSMPPLADGWSASSGSATSDSGHATDPDAPPTMAVTASDTVKVNSETIFQYYNFMTNISCSRTTHPLPSELRDKAMPMLSMMLILQQILITYFIYTRRPYFLSCSEIFTGTSKFNTSLFYNFARGE